MEQYLRVPKKFVVISGSESKNFAEVFKQHTDQEPEILFMSAKKYEKRSLERDFDYCTACCYGT